MICISLDTSVLKDQTKDNIQCKILITNDYIIYEIFNINSITNGANVRFTINDIVLSSTTR